MLLHRLSLKPCFTVGSWVTTGMVALSASIGCGQSAEPIGVVTSKDSESAAASPAKQDAEALVTIQRGQTLVANSIPSDLMLRREGRVVAIGLRQDGVAEQVKTKAFTAETATDIRTMVASFFGGRQNWRYGVSFENTVSESTSALNIPGSESERETLSGVLQSLQIETGMNLSEFSAGLSLSYYSAKYERETPVAGTSVTTSGKRLTLVQPGVSLAWRRDQTLLTVLRNQETQDDDAQFRIILPWTSAVRLVQLLEEDQGVRAQFERRGSASPDSTATNAGVVGYFLTIDRVTVDIGWLGRSRSYSASDQAAADQLVTFGFGISSVWHVSPTADLSGSLHSLSANDTLGGSDKRTAHQLVSGGNLGIQVAF